MKYIIFLLLSFVCLSSHSQTITPVGPAKEKPQKEKKWLKPPEKPSQTVMAEWSPVVVNHYVGLRGGYGAGSVRFEPQRNSQMYLGMLNFGVGYRFDVPKQKYVGCIEVDLEYMEKGYKYETFNESGIFNSRKYSTITLPILWQPYLPLSKNGYSRFHLNLGPFFSYALAGTTGTYDKNNDITTNDGPYKYDPLRDNRWEFGITAGAGITFAIKRFNIGIDFRYNIALSDTFKGAIKYTGNPFRSPVDQMNLSMSLSYRLPSKKKTATTDIVTPTVKP